MARDIVIVVDAIEAGAALCTLEGFADARVEGPIGDGWSSWTFLVDDTWIVRFPRTDAGAETQLREQRLLGPLAAATPDVGIPVPEITGLWNGRPFSGYR